MKYGLIYSATNINNGKMYIGQTINFYNRKHKHKSIAYNSDNNEICRFHRSIKKYGYKSFMWEILCEVSADNIQTLKKKLNYYERRFIYMYNTYCAGYNDTLGGDINIGYKHKKSSIDKIRKARSKQKITHSDKTKEKISRSLMGHSVLDETRAKISKFNVGKVLSKETRDKISKNSAPKRPEVAKKISDSLSKKWFVIKPDNTECVIINLKKYCMANNLSYTYMIDVSKNRRNHCKGYKCSKLDV